MNICKRYVASRSVFLLAAFGFILIAHGSVVANDKTTAFQSLQQYLEVMISEYPPTDESGDIKKKSPFGVQGKTSKFWNLRPKDPETHDLKSIQFFSLFQPTQYSVVSEEEAGQFIRIDLDMLIGSPLQRRLSGKDSPVRRIQYQLVDTGDGSWKLVSFLDLTARDLAKQRKEEIEEKKSFAQVEEGLSAKDHLTSYLNKMISMHPPMNKNNSGQQFMANTFSQAETGSMVIDQYWSIRDRMAKRASAQSMSPFSMLRPGAFSITDFNEQDKSARATVSLEAVEGLMKSMAKRKLFYELEKLPEGWKIVGFEWR